MGTFILEPLFLILVAFIVAAMLHTPILTAIALGLYIGLRIWRASVRMERRARDDEYKQAVVTLARQQKG